MKVLGYIRVSTEEQVKEGVSLLVQRSKIEAYCKLYDLDLIDIYADDGESGKNLRRPGIKTVLAMLNQGQADGVVITKLDRLSRSTGDWDYLIKNYFGEKAGYQLSSVGDSIDTRTAAGRLVLNVLMSVAQWEREAIAERTKDGMDHLGKQKRLRGEVPYGSDAVPRTTLTKDGKERSIHDLVPNEREQAVIAQMRRWRAEGLGCKRIAQRLTSMGVATKTGNTVWIHTVVARILNRPAARQAA
jgi:site-specific DNA recombinase